MFIQKSKVGAIICDIYLDSGDCQEFFLLIVPADEDLVSLNFGHGMMHSLTY